MSERKEGWERQAKELLKHFEQLLMVRQSMFCSPFIHHQHRLEIEKDILSKATTDPIAKEIGMEEDLKEIFQRDKHCAEKWNSDGRKNGKLMWIYISKRKIQCSLMPFMARLQENALGRPPDVKS
uniref:Uncharacterized protein n=1 Tax=Callorhinchus milii TaxID=7868 RepID=A0A4W3IZE8_CALMI